MHAAAASDVKNVKKTSDVRLFFSRLLARHADWISWKKPDANFCECIKTNHEFYMDKIMIKHSKINISLSSSSLINAVYMYRIFTDGYHKEQ